MPVPPTTIIAIASPIFPIITGLRKRNSCLWWYALMCLTAELLTSGTLHFTLYNYKAFVNPFFLLEFILLSLAYRKMVLRDSRVFYFLIIGMPVLFVSHMHNAFWDSRDYRAISFFFLAYILYGLVGFYRLMSEPEETFLEQSSFFWQNIACLLYGAGSFLLFLFKVELDKASKEIFTGLWQYMYATLNILKHLCIGIALIKLKPSASVRTG